MKLYFSFVWILIFSKCLYSQDSTQLKIYVFSPLFFGQNALSNASGPGYGIGFSLGFNRNKYKFYGESELKIISLSDQRFYGNTSKLRSLNLSINVSNNLLQYQEWMLEPFAGIGINFLNHQILERGVQYAFGMHIKYMLNTGNVIFLKVAYQYCPYAYPLIISADEDLFRKSKNINIGVGVGF